MLQLSSIHFHNYKPTQSTGVALSVTSNSSALNPTIGAYTVAGNSYTRMWTLDSLTGTNSFTSTSGGTIALLIVAGGGGGGGAEQVSEGQGGGGAGGIIFGTISLTANATYSVSIGTGGTFGKGGANGTAIAPTNGGNTSVIGSGISEIARGGGRGGFGNSTTSGTGADGGSGGGSSSTFGYKNPGGRSHTTVNLGRRAISGEEQGEQAQPQ